MTRIRCRALNKIGAGNSDRLFGSGGQRGHHAEDPGRGEDDLVDCGSGFDRVTVDPSAEIVVAANRGPMTVTR